MTIPRTHLISFMCHRCESFIVILIDQWLHLWVAWYCKLGTTLVQKLSVIRRKLVQVEIYPLFWRKRETILAFRDLKRFAKLRILCVSVSVKVLDILQSRTTSMRNTALLVNSPLRRYIGIESSFVNWTTWSPNTKNSSTKLSFASK